MRTKVKQWGNSIAVRIPKAAAETLQLRVDSEVELTVSDGLILINPKNHRESLDGLLERITPANLHHEVETGSPQGQEAW